MTSGKPVMVQSVRRMRSRRTKYCVQRGLGALPSTSRAKGKITAGFFLLRPSVLTPALLAKTCKPRKWRKKRRPRLRILRFFDLFYRLDRGLYNFQFFFVQGAQHGVNSFSALAFSILERIEILIYRYIEHRSVISF